MILVIQAVWEAMSFASDLVVVLGALGVTSEAVVTVAVLFASIVVVAMLRGDGGGGAPPVQAEAVPVRRIPQGAYAGHWKRSSRKLFNVYETSTEEWINWRL